MNLIKNYGMLDDLDEDLKVKQAIRSLQAIASVQTRAGCHKVNSEHVQAVGRFSVLLPSKRGVTGGNRIYFVCSDRRCHESCHFQIQFNKSRKMKDNVKIYDSDGLQIDNSIWLINPKASCFEHLCPGEHAAAEQSKLNAEIYWRENDENDVSIAKSNSSVIETANVVYKTYDYRDAPYKADFRTVEGGCVIVGSASDTAKEAEEIEKLILEWKRVFADPRLAEESFEPLGILNNHDFRC
jgi:hypothetical protein